MTTASQLFSQDSVGSLGHPQQLSQLNQALSEAKAVAEAANQSKTRFLAAVSHDLMQPLNAARLCRVAGSPTWL